MEILITDKESALNEQNNEPSPGANGEVNAKSAHKQKKPRRMTGTVLNSFLPKN